MSSRTDEFFGTLLQNMDEVLEILRESGSPCGFPVYCSMDIRDAGWKICAVDVNLFPAGFNILSERDKDMAAKRMREFFAAKLLSHSPWCVVVVPEAHTNNQGYLENLTGILDILRKADVEARLLWPGEPALPKPWVVKTRNGQELTYLPPDEALRGAQAILLNNDLSSGVPKIIQNTKLPTFPSAQMGWYRRRKSSHHEIVEALLARLQKRLPFFDPWYFTPQTVTLPGVDFGKDESLQEVADTAEQLMNKIAADYKSRGISDKPRIFIKNDAGTYGQGVVSIGDPAEIREGSRSLRNTMKKGKGAVAISQVIVQEGVPTYYRYEKSPGVWVAGEPTLYLVDGLPIGGFMRIHEGLGADSGNENLNQPGSLLESLDCCDKTGTNRRPFPHPRGASPCEEILSRRVYDFIARLHATAAGLEECPQ